MHDGRNRLANLGPSGFGLAAAKLISVGHSVAVLWLGLVLLAMLLWVVRNLFGFVSVLTVGYLIYLLARDGSVHDGLKGAYAMAWLLLWSGIRVVLSHWTGARDATILTKMTRIGPSFWASLWLAGSVAAAITGASVLI